MNKGIKMCKLCDEINERQNEKINILYPAKLPKPIIIKETKNVHKAEAENEGVVLAKKHLAIMICIILIVSLFLMSTSFADNEFGKNYKPYECENFKVGDKVTSSSAWVCFKKTDFVGIVVKIEPKPTNEYIHWITIKKFSGEGESGFYSVLNNIWKD